MPRPFTKYLYAHAREGEKGAFPRAKAGMLEKVYAITNRIALPVRQGVRVMGTSTFYSNGARASDRPGC